MSARRTGGAERAGASRRLALKALLAAPLSAGCGSLRYVQWKERKGLRGHTLAPRVPLVLMNERAHEKDPYGYIDTMLLTVQSELRERGVEAEIVHYKPRRLPLPRVEIRILYMEEGDAAVSALSKGFLYGAPLGDGTLEVSCQSVSEDNRVLFTGTVVAIASEENLRNLSEETGHAIAKALTKNHPAQ